jgi:pilus assembly protein CpaD
MTAMSRFPHAILLGLTGLAAAACTSPPLNNSASQNFDVQERFPITVEPQVATLAVQVDGDLNDLARGEDARIATFAERWKARGQGLINIAAPSGGPGGRTGALEQVKKVLSASGVASSAVHVTAYDPASGDTQAPISLSFVAYAATAPDCGDSWPDNLAYDPRNTPHSNFGCSTQHNLAAIIADPRDLIEPRPSTPSDATRRSDVLDKYQRGLLTQTKRDTSDAGTSSDVKN